MSLGHTEVDENLGEYGFRLCHKLLELCAALAAEVRFFAAVSKRLNARGITKKRTPRAKEGV
jgi:hypothetical protein